ncbi:ERF family protein [Enterococcus faecalis]|uniref:Recombination protein / single-stranded DNA-binding protein n=1 Tax=Enterococcus phage VEsP-1 TaxID=2859528 RepID=A0AAE7WEC4_9CAUD|nr:ERF family protein [Enterococcus faecalis]QYI86518.1 putative recombination protein / single-stranded DNA-binding protein [Enterococcus phage VEsP-1]EJU93512.1 Erf family protein [Enterococcus faecalis 599]MCD5092439.1 ERF family protein [Enterococcus faecalis]NSN45594.1 ERF family protein [Enterococcus faecalis]OGX75249.1 single-stranded DNA-binding protein [Enterococcus faecalis]
MSEETELTFYQKFLKVIERLNVKKDLVNDFNNFNYRNAESILREVKPLCIEYGLYIHTTKNIIRMENRFYVEAIVKITDGENEVEAVAYAREPEDKPKMDASQVTGSASSYAKKYALCDLLMIDDGRDDPDVPKNEQDMNVEMVDGKQLALLKNEAVMIAGISGNEPSAYTQALAKMANVASIEVFPKEYFNEALQTLNNWKMNAIQEQQAKEMQHKRQQPRQSNVFN